MPAMDRVCCVVKTARKSWRKHLRHFEGERVVMISFVVMPNHVHAVFVQNPEFPLEKLIRELETFHRATN